MQFKEDNKGQTFLRGLSMLKLQKNPQQEIKTLMFT